jgi:hypothetical protein
LAWNTLNYSNNVAGVKRLVFIANFLFFNQEQALTLNLDIVVLLLSRTLAKAASAPDAAIRANLWSATICTGVRTRGPIEASSASTPSIGDVLALLFLFFLALLIPHLIDVKELDGNKIAFKSAVAIFASADENVRVEICRGNVGIGPILLIDPQVSLRKVRSEQSLALLLLLLLSRHLLRCALSTLNPHVLAVKLTTLLQSLQMGYLQGIELLTAKQLRLCDNKLALGKLDDLRLVCEGKLANAADRLGH